MRATLSMRLHASAVVRNFRTTDSLHNFLLRFYMQNSVILSGEIDIAFFGTTDLFLQK